MAAQPQGPPSGSGPLHSARLTPTSAALTMRSCSEYPRCSAGKVKQRAQAGCTGELMLSSGLGGWWTVGPAHSNGHSDKTAEQNITTSLPQPIQTFGNTPACQPQHTLHPRTLTTTATVPGSLVASGTSNRALCRLGSNLSPKGSYRDTPSRPNTCTHRGECFEQACSAGGPGQAGKHAAASTQHAQHAALQL